MLLFLIHHIPPARPGEASRGGGRPTSVLLLHACSAPRSHVSCKGSMTQYFRYSHATPLAPPPALFPEEGTSHIPQALGCVSGAGGVPASHDKGSGPSPWCCQLCQMLLIIRAADTREALCGSCGSASPAFQFILTAAPRACVTDARIQTQRYDVAQAGTHS